MTEQQAKYTGKLAVVYNDTDDQKTHQQLADRLAVPLYSPADVSQETAELFFLGWRDGCLKLFDHSTLKKGGLSVDFDKRGARQRSWPAAKKGPMAQALGRKTKTVIDATAGWGGDSFLIYSMGYELICLERSPVMAELLTDGFARLQKQEWLVKSALAAPQFIFGDAINRLAELENQADCIYLDPMFPPKRKESALAKKSMLVLRDLLGDDMDKQQLFEAAIKATAKRVVVKSPDYAEPLAGKPSESFHGKLLRYDVYLK